MCMKWKDSFLLISTIYTTGLENRISDHFGEFLRAMWSKQHKRVTYENALHLPILSFFFFFSTAFPEYLGIRSKKYFTDYGTANAVQLFVAT